MERLLNSSRRADQPANHRAPRAPPNTSPRHADKAEAATTEPSHAWCCDNAFEVLVDIASQLEGRVYYARYCAADLHVVIAFELGNRLQREGHHRRETPQYRGGSPPPASAPLPPYNPTKHRRRAEALRVVGGSLTSSNDTSQSTGTTASTAGSATWRKPVRRASSGSVGPKNYDLTKRSRIMHPTQEAHAGVQGPACRVILRRPTGIPVTELRLLCASGTNPCQPRMRFAEHDRFVLC